MSKKLLFVAALMLIAVLAFAQPWPPTNLEASVVNQTSVQLDWNAPQNPDQTELRYDDGENYDGIGTNSANDFDVAIRFDTSDLASYDGYTLNQIGFFPRYEDCEYYVRVWTGGSLSGDTLTEGDLVVDQAVDVTITEWNYITLDTPLTIDAGEELWIGYRANTNGDHPAGCDAGPAIAYKGDLLNLGGWFSMVTDYPTLNYNWNIVGLVSEGRTGGELVPLASSPRPAANTEATFEREFVQVENATSPRDRDLTGYSIYRDGEEIATVDGETLTYTDANLADGTYEYYVTALWDEGESDPSNTVEAIIQDMGYALYEGFEGGALPANWTTEYVSGTVDWEFQDGGYSGHPEGAYSGNYNAYIYAGNYDGNTTRLISPVLDLSGEATLYFYHTQAVWSGDQDELTLMYRTSSDNAWEALETWTDDISAWELEEIDLPNLSSTYQICFEGFLNYGYGICIDEVIIGVPGETGTIAGTVTDAETNSPIQGATVTCGSGSGQTNASGNYSFEVGTGTYDVTCVAAGYVAQTENNVVITTDQTTNVDFSMVAASDFPAPSNFTAVVENDVNVHLSWASPYTELRYDDGENFDGIGTNSANDFDVAIRFDTDDLSSYDGMSLGQIGFFPRYEDCDYYIRVWTGGSLSGTTFTEGDLVVDQAVDVTIDQWNYFTIDTPVTIDAGEELWIGYRANTGGDHPAGCDAGPAIAFKGDLLNLGGWFSMVTDYPTLNYNWNIVGYASGGRASEELVPIASKPRQINTASPFEQEFTNTITPEPIDRNRDLSGFKVYRDGEEIAYIEDAFTLDYIDEGLEPGTYTYYATAVYNSGVNESDPSNSADATIEELTYPAPENLVADPHGMNVLLTWDAPGTNQDAVDSIDEGFETGAIADGWSLVDVDNDGYNWEIVDTEYGTHSGDYAIASASYINDIGALTPDNWLITPPIAIQSGYELNFWLCAQDADWPAEHYEVMLSTGGMNPNDFDVTLTQGTLSTGDWVEVNVDLSDYAGQNCRLAFVHCDVTDMYWIKMDDIYVNNARGEAVFAFNAEKQSRTLKDDGSVYVAPMMDRNRPTLDSYNIYRDDQYLATQNNVNITVWNDVNVPAGSHSYYVTAVYTDGNESDPSNTENITGNDPDNTPRFTELNGNYPNPFNPTTTIEFSLAENAQVTIEVYNLKGQLVRTLANEKMDAGNHQVVWTGDDSQGKSVGSGVYFYKMKAGRYTATKKMILLK